jgi:hypothetical protein
MTTRTYKNVSQQQIADLTAKADGAGIRLEPVSHSPNHWMINKLTVSALLSYNPATETLTAAVSGFGSGLALSKIEAATGLKPTEGV